MPDLSLFLLGSFQLSLDGERVAGFASNKVRALLAYLAVEAHRPHRRTVLAGLLWPESPDRAALRSLRSAVHNLRTAIGDRGQSPPSTHPNGPLDTLPCLLINRDTVEFNPARDFWLDVAAFNAGLDGDERACQDGDYPDQHALDQLEQAAALCRGEFLEGFSVADSPAFEEWLLFEREELRRKALIVFYRLADIHQHRGGLLAAQSYARRQLELDPCREEAHRQLMHLLSISGQRNTALAQYEICRTQIAEDLGAEPSPETTELFQRIRAGSLNQLRLPARESKEQPDFAPPQESPSPSDRSRPNIEPFVARKQEMATLHEFLEKAHAGQGQVAFVTGDAGSGKTALVAEFGRQAMKIHGDLVVVTGGCCSQAGVGDSLVPFREILQMLSGETEKKRAAGDISHEHALRLWALLPETVQALVEHAPGLIDILVPSTALVTRAEAFAPGGTAWRTRLEELVKRLPQRRRTDSVTARRQDSLANSSNLRSSLQSNLFEQVTKVFQALARHQALILVFDDLQWADGVSTSLLFHLGRQLLGHRIFIIGAFRPGDVLVEPRPGSPSLGRHPLEPVVNELRRDLGDIVIDLNQADDRQLVEDYLDTQPNRLGAGFRDKLYRHTGGNPLFTVELLNEFRENGSLVQNEEGCWELGPALDWYPLPARIEAVIAESVRRLPPDWQEMLTVASVEGEEFTAEVLARVQGIDEDEAIQVLSGPLSRHHRLVRAQDRQWSNPEGRMCGQCLSHYRFQHTLLQKYLYETLDEVTRARLHQAVGSALETLLEEGTDESWVQLALHFEGAGLTGQAADYMFRTTIDGQRAQLGAPLLGQAWSTRSSPPGRRGFTHPAGAISDDSAEHPSTVVKPEHAKNSIRARRDRLAKRHPTSGLGASDRTGGGEGPPH